jgi:hypothetical protein
LIATSFNRFYPNVDDCSRFSLAKFGIQNLFDRK